jgi:hypothetical protein
MALPLTHSPSRLGWTVKRTAREMQQFKTAPFSAVHVLQHPRVAGDLQEGQNETLLTQREFHGGKTRKNILPRAFKGFNEERLA